MGEEQEVVLVFAGVRLSVPSTGRIVASLISQHGLSVAWPNTSHKRLRIKPESGESRWGIDDVKHLQCVKKRVQDRFALTPAVSAAHQGAAALRRRVLQAAGAAVLTRRALLGNEGDDVSGVLAPVVAQMGDYLVYDDHCCRRVRHGSGGHFPAHGTKTTLICLPAAFSIVGREINAIR